MDAGHMDEEIRHVDKRNFKKWYKQKEFMEEMLKSKNMMSAGRK